ncbi:MAG: PAS domain-containing protein, partial [Desulfomonilaceae bacterium]
MSSAHPKDNTSLRGLSCRFPLESIPEPAFLVNHEGQIIDCNGAAVNLFDLKRNLPLPDIIPALFPSVIPDQNMDISEDIIKSPRIRHILVNLSGRNYQCTCIPVAITSDKIDGVSIVLQDWTANRVDEYSSVNQFDG